MGLEVFCMKLAMLALILPVRGQHIKSGPGHVVSMLGETAIFHCEIDFGPQKAMSWYFDTDIIYSIMHGNEDYPNENDNYLVKTDANGSTLTVKHLRYDDGGKYSCHAAEKEGIGSLVVLGTPSLNYSTLVENENASFSCEVGFGGPVKDSISGEHYPELLMFFDEKLLEIPTTESYQVLSKTFNTKAEANFDGKIISCEIRTSKINVTAASIMNVLYSVRNISFSPQLGTIEIGSNLNCTAKGNPQPSIEWINENQPDLKITDQRLIVTEAMMGMNVWKCTAKNSIGGVLHQDSVFASFQVEAPDNKSNKPLFVTIGIGILVCLCCFGIVIFLRHKKRRRQIDEKYDFQKSEVVELIPLENKQVEVWKEEEDRSK